MKDSARQRSIRRNENPSEVVLRPGREDERPVQCIDGFGIEPASVRERSVLSSLAEVLRPRLSRNLNLSFEIADEFGESRLWVDSEMAVAQSCPERDCILWIHGWLR